MKQKSQPYNCNECDYKSNQKHALRFHTEAKHDGIIYTFAFMNKVNTNDKCFSVTCVIENVQHLAIFNFTKELRTQQQRSTVPNVLTRQGASEL